MYGWIICCILLDNADIGSRMKMFVAVAENAVDEPVKVYISFDSGDSFKYSHVTSMKPGQESIAWKKIPSALKWCLLTITLKLNKMMKVDLDFTILIRSIHYVV